MSRASQSPVGVAPEERILVVIPALNEARTVGDVVRSILRAHHHAQAVVVDDGSRDNTAPEALAAGAIVIRHPFNCGYGTALHTGLIHASRIGATLVVFIDADGQHEVSDIDKLLQPLRTGAADLVLGSRFLPGSRCYNVPLSRRWTAWLLSKALSSLIGVSIQDTTTGFQALGAKAIRAFLELRAFPERTPDADLILYAHMRGCRVQEVAVTMHEDATGDSMHGILKSMFYVPKMFVSMLSVILAYGSYRR